MTINVIEGEKRPSLKVVGGNLNGIMDQINSHLSDLEELMGSEDKSVAEAAEKSWNDVDVLVAGLYLQSLLC